MKIKRIALSIGLALAITGTARAQSTFTQVQPSIGGGYNIYGSDGSFTQMHPSIGGGYNIHTTPPPPPITMPSVPAFGGYRGFQGEE